MSEFTLDRLLELLTVSAGEDEDVDLTGDVSDTLFADLGYDSLALLETAGLVQREYGITLDDDALAAAETPRLFLEAVNQHLSQRA